MPSQSGWIVVALLLGLVYVPPAWASSVAGGRAGRVPLFVQPDSWSLVNVSVVLSGRDIVATRDQPNRKRWWLCVERGSVIWVSCPPEA